MPQTALFRFHMRDSLFDLVATREMNKERSAESSLQTLSITRELRMKDSQLLGEETEAVALQSKTKHTGVQAALRHGCPKDLSENIPLRS